MKLLRQHERKTESESTSYSLPPRELTPPPSCTLLHPSLRAHSRSLARFRTRHFARPLGPNLDGQDEGEGSRLHLLELVEAED